MADPHFWDDPESANQLIQRMKGLRGLIAPLDELQQEMEDLEVLDELAREEKDDQACQEVSERIEQFCLALQKVELQSMLGHPEDPSGAFLSVHAGAGGTESCDWAQMLLRMYTRWAEIERHQTNLIDCLPGEEAGIKNATLHVMGKWAYGYLKGEIGVHRLVRISPFDSGRRRHTSFAAVDVVPEVSGDIEVDIKENEIEIDFFRASGPGGQHVNKTSSAVRIKHVPTGITISCQTERSQHKNRRIGLALLKAKLYQHELQKQREELQKAYNEKGEIAWGNQIRSYVLQPYQLVKDTRTGYETSDTSGILDGNLMPFMEAHLRYQLEQKQTAH